MRVILLHYYNAIANPAYSQIAQALRHLGHEVIVAYRNEQNDLVFDTGTEVGLAVAAPRQSRLSGVFASLLNRFYFLLFILRIRRFLQAKQAKQADQAHQIQIVQINPAGISGYWLIPLFNSSAKFVLDCRQVAVRSRPINPLRALRQSMCSVRHRFSIKYIFDQTAYLHKRGAKKELGEQWQKFSTVVPLGVGGLFLNSPLSNPEFGEPLKFIYIGSITRIRKLDVLLEAVKILKAQGKLIKLVFAGPDNTGGHYQQWVQQWQLEEEVTFLGAVAYDEIPALLRQYHVALAYVPDEPQDWVYQPTLKVLEYQALAMPVLASDVPPNVDIIQAHGNGLVVAGGSAADWAKGMIHYIEAPGFYQSVLKSAQDHRSGESWQDVARLYLQVYEALN